MSTAKAKTPLAPTHSAPVRPFEFGLAIIWFLVTFNTFRNDHLVLYPLAIYFSYATFRDRRATFPLIIGAWPLFLLPLWALASSPLGVEPDVAFRSGLQMLLTSLICVLFAAWMSPRQVLIAAFIATGICGILSVFFTKIHDGAMTGIFAHKNMLGAKMVVLWAAALCLACDRWVRPWLRLVAVALAALAFLLILASHSATALVLSFTVVCIIGAFSFFSRSADRIAAGLIVLGAMASLAPFLIEEREHLLELFLGSVGKSKTLTGRTELWNYAEDVIRQNPIIGQGAGGFWRYQESPLVQEIFAEFHKSPNQVFSFHNAYYEITVHFGLIGLGCILVTLAWALTHLAFLVFRRGGMPFVFLLTGALVQTVRTMVESDLMRPFVLANMLIWIGACYAIKNRNPIFLPERVVRHGIQRRTGGSGAVPDAAQRTASTGAE
ncbi:O-antigen ligase [Salipiger sp. PrR002]|uniref:O-antigen ligase family protein n=1 Tax=Salipiger sp. PrR002 TaxID=2706489 RepID=UPI0013B781F6|nr:O-antigen ligase family protein [Salipiger sp. PrR002]NDW01730.1 O-antigen ligase family protein [Salipiger sp. PrR002]NDW57833.1 O-antigen ligase family protein [Salipiger sp. PrR004]